MLLIELSGVVENPRDFSMFFCDSEFTFILRTHYVNVVLLLFTSIKQGGEVFNAKRVIYWIRCDILWTFSLGL